MSNPMKQFGWLHISEPLELRYLEANAKHNISDFINRKAFRVSDTPLTYRQVNTLDKDNLLGEEREEDRTWREFSPKEMIYILIVSELKKFGIEHNKLRTLWDAFFKEPVKIIAGTKVLKPQVSKGVAETAIGCVFGEVEMFLIVSSDGDIAFYDPSNFAAHDTLLHSLPSAYIKLSLNDYVNETLEMMKKKPLSVSWSVSDEFIKSRVLDVKPKEKQLLEIIRNKDYQAIRIKKKNGEVSIVHAEKSKEGILTEADVIKIMKEGAFQDIAITQRDGNVVSLKHEKVFKL